MSGAAERWRRLEELCHAALERPAHERDAFLAEACGADEELRRETASLLDRDARAEAFLATPLGELAANALTYSPDGSAHREASSLSIGQHIGTYEIRVRVGAGGMGEVYRAHDHRLGRDVAIKVLPPDFSADAARLARFEREARLLASLSHPHIGAIYGLEVSGDVRALVLEFIDGETLETTIARGPLAVTQALTLAVQIAEALDHAHRKGVTHRDLKPANIMLTHAGVKLLDFGLAKWAAGPRGYVASSAVADQAHQSGLESLTQEGMILGTPHYMAPEQLEGKPVDGRADVFAFGAVLYEMLTGEKAFTGGSVAAVMAAVLTAEPAPLAALQRLVPPSLERVIRKCLAKDPEQRWQTARDLADALRWIDEERRPAMPVPAESRAALRTGSMHWAWTGAIVAAVALGVAVFTLWPRVVVAPGVTRRFTIQPSGDARIWRPQPRFAMSADGRAIAYIANSGQKNSVYVRLLDQTAPRQLPGTEGAVELAFSPDGQWLAFEANNTLKQVSLTSGAPPVTLASVTNILDQSLTWLSDDTIVVGQLEKGLSTIPAGGGAMATLTTPDALHGELDHHFPRPLPGGKALLFTRHRKANAEVFDVAVLHVDTGAVRVVLADAFDARYIAPGHLVFARSGSLFVVPFDLDRLELTGTPVVMVERVMTASNVAGSGTFGWGARYAIADDGTLAYIPAPARAGRRLVWVSGGGAIEPLPLEPRAFSRPSLSPDGKRVAVQVEDDGLDVWVSEISQRTSTRLTWDGVSQAPIWTPDGQRVTFSTIKDGREELHWQRLDGGASERLRSDDVRLYPGSWSPHGRTLAFLRNPPSDVTSFGLFDVGTRSATPLLPDQSDVVHPQISPDGLWVAYTSQSPRQQIHVSSVDGRGVKRQISTDGGFAPAWSPDGRRLYYLGPAGVRDVFMVDVSRLPSAVGKPQLFAKDFPMVRGGVLHPGFDVAPDGRLLMVQSDPEEAAPLRFEIVINWFEELKRRVPLGQ